MLRVLSAELWPTIDALSTKAEHRHAAVAYVTSDEHVVFGRGDILVVDASDAAIAGGRTSAEVLAAAHKRGARLFSLPDLHAKVICLSRFAVVGSANLSSLSAETLVEAGIVTDLPNVLAEARALVAQLREAATPIDEAFVSHILAIPVTARPVGRRARRTVVRESESRVWLVGVHDVDDAEFPDEIELAERGRDVAATKAEEDGSDISWLRFTGTSRFRKEARPGDTVIQIWRRSTKAKSAEVYFPAPLIHRQDEPTCTRFYVEEFEDQTERSVHWKDFVRMWSSVSDNPPPPLACARLLTSKVGEGLVALWPS